MKDFQKALEENTYLSDSFLFDEKLMNTEIIECKEELVPVTQEKGIVIHPNVPKEQCLLRKTPASFLIKAGEMVANHDLSLMVMSSYRSLSEQKQRFVVRVSDMQSQYPHASSSEISRMANVYTAGIPILAAHTAGAAIDVVLVDKDMQLIDMGVPYPHGGKESTTDYPFFSKDVIGARQFLKEVMESVGFTNYPFEYWHFSVGDVCDAVIKNKAHAVYGPVEFNQDNQTHIFLPASVHKSFLTEIEL